MWHGLALLLVGATAFPSDTKRFKSDRDETWQQCFTSKCASIDGVGLSI